MKFAKLYKIITAGILAMSSPALAEPTEVVVRVISQDAKFVGDQMGGARVVLRDAETGEVLADGITTGGTGNTKQIVPGQPVTSGDGWVVELPGLAVNIIAPQPNTHSAKGSRTIEVMSSTMLMCGCPITSGGLWDAKDYEVEVAAYQAGRKIASGKLDFVEAPGRFGGDLTLPEKGAYELFVSARNTRTGNTGVDRTSVIVP